MQSHNSIIERWMRMVLATDGIDRFDDLHIDRIDRIWRERDSWFDGASEALRLAKELKLIIAPEKTLAIMCSLISEDCDLVIPISPTELSEQMDYWTPPSLYLFEPKGEPWTNSGSVTITPTVGLFPVCSECFVMEFKTRENEHRRTFVAVS